jgi:hypothetical protein
MLCFQITGWTSRRYTDEDLTHLLAYSIQTLGFLVQVIRSLRFESNSLVRPELPLTASLTWWLALCKLRIAKSVLDKVRSAICGGLSSFQSTQTPGRNHTMLHTTLLGPDLKVKSPVIEPRYPRRYPVRPAG